MSAIFFWLHFTLVDFILFWTTMGNTFEFRLQTPSAKTVDGKTIDFAKSFAEFKTAAEKQLASLKDQIKNSKTWKQAKNFLSNVPLVADPGNLTLTIGKQSFKAKTQEEYDEYVRTTNLTLEETENELSDHLITLEKEEEQEAEDASNQTKQEVKAVKKDIKTGKDVDGNTITETTTVTETFEYEDDQPKAKTPSGDAAPEDAGKSSDAVPEKIIRTWNIDKHFANFDSADGITKAFEANPSYINQQGATPDGPWDDQDILVHATDRNNPRVKLVEGFYHIDTYSPLFITNDNLNGTICLPKSEVKKMRLPKASPAPDNYDENEPNAEADRRYRYYNGYDERYTDEENDMHAGKEWIKKNPEDAEACRKGGVVGALVDNFVQYTNFPPKSAGALKSAAKIGALIGMGVLGWKTLKKIFKGEKDAWKWGLGAAGVLIGIPAITGQGIDKLLFSGDSKDAWRKTKDLFHLNDLADSVSEMFEGTDKAVIRPALANTIFSTMTVEEYRRYTTIDNEGVCRMKSGDLIAKFETDRDNALERGDQRTAEACQAKIDMIQSAVKNKQQDELTDPYNKKLGLDSADKSKTCGELYMNYINAQEKAGKIIDSNKHLKITDQAALNDRLVELTIKEGKKPSEIKIADLLGHGLEYDPDADATAAATGAAVMGAGAAGIDKTKTTDNNTDTDTDTKTDTDKDTDNEPVQSEQKEEEPIFVSEADALANPSKYHLQFNPYPASDYEWVEADHHKSNNYAVRKKGDTTAVPAVTLDDIKKDRKAHNVSIDPIEGYRWYDKEDGTNFATEAIPAWEKMEKWTGEKWKGFKETVSSVSKKLSNYVKKLMQGEPDSATVAELKKQVAREKAKLKELKAQFKQLDKLDDLKKDIIDIEKEIGLVKVEIEEDDIKITKIENMIGTSIEPGLNPANKNLLKWLTEDQKKELTRADKKVNFEMKFERMNDEARLQVYTDDKLYLQSWGEKTNIRMADGKYYLDGLMVPFNDAEAVVRMANLTNFLKIHFANRATTNVTEPWYIANDGDLTFKEETAWDAAKKMDVKGLFFNIEGVDGPDNFSSTIKKMG